MEKDAAKIKEEILNILRKEGPNIPATISKKINQSILFTSAFLSELFSEKKVKMSNLRIGSSPLYFLDGQEHLLEGFSDFLKGKEKEAFLLLKDKKFLKDSELEPAIRVALRQIRDFAIPFYNNNEIYWRFFLVPEEEFYRIKEEKKEEEIKSTQTNENYKIKEKRKETKVRSESKKSRLKKEKESFFNKVKEKISSKNEEIVDILDFKKNEIVLKVKKENKEKIVFVFNKKKLSENDFINAFKRSKEFNLPYEIIFFGKVNNKFNEFITALKELSSIEGR
ncbi:MAG: hypothetical protein KatS3mg001_229 [Candidatus Pacearchaeota archaeon]|nr:MAG: hypothetical protein KatS3mg001_229 [Candidatus Pacearchaeota archaeon]